MRVIALRQLHGDYGDKDAGETFECADQTARELLAMGLVRKAEPPAVHYETKIIRPTEVGPTVPFRDVFTPDQKPEEVAAACDPVLPVADAPKPGIIGGLRRRGRSRSNS